MEKLLPPHPPDKSILAYKEGMPKALNSQKRTQGYFKVSPGMLKVFPNIIQDLTQDGCARKKVGSLAV